MNRREILASRPGCRSPLVTGMTLDIQHCQAVAPNGHDTLDRMNYGLRLACKPSVSRFDALQDVKPAHRRFTVDRELAAPQFDRLLVKPGRRKFTLNEWSYLPVTGA